jgi:peptidoglycan/LPS O-acetylase OafA/YrhL
VPPVPTAEGAGPLPLAGDDRPAARTEEASERSWFRGDIDGLRAVAIVLVVAFHARVPGFGGGFIGVDVFFVISGYLITRKLVSEAERTGRVHLVRFWANRAKRLVPAMGLMVVVTFVLSAVILSPIETTSLAVQGGSAVLYVSNIVFARADTGYFAESLAVSPFLHTWSLSLEEQFYLVWPVMLVLVALVVRARPLPRRWLVAVLAIGSVASMALNLVVTGAAPTWAFYSLPTRAWEFGVAGLLALVTIPAALQDRRVQLGAAAVGVVLLAVGTVRLDEVGYPGVQAVVPVAATILLIHAGTPFAGQGTATARMLATAPMQWVGRVSYSWYLWHWPFMVLAVALLDTDTVEVRLVAGLLALPVAWALYTRFERPIRFSPRLIRSPGAALGVAAGVSVVALIAAVGFARYEQAARAGEPAATLLAVKADFAKNRCSHDEVSASGVPYCVGGDVDSDRTVVLIGDSHARHWEEAFSERAEAAGIRFVSRWKGACPSMPVTNRVWGDTATAQCWSYREDTATLLRDLQPDAVVISNSYLYGDRLATAEGDLLDDVGAAAAWHDAFVAHVEAVRSETSAPVGRISDSPDMVDDPLACLSRPGNSIEGCRVPRDEALAFGAGLRAAEDRASGELGDLPTLQTVDPICDDHWCQPRQGDLYVFVDPNHLSKEWTRSQADHIDALFAELGLTT